MTDEPFDLLEFVKGRSRAKSEVSLYTDEDASKRAATFIKYNKTGDPVGVTDPEKFEEAREDLKKSVVIVHLEGLIEGRVEEIRGEHDIKAGAELSPDTDNDALENYLVAVLTEMYQKSVSSDGREDSSKRTIEQWVEFKKIVPSSQWQKLLGEVLNLVFVANLIDDNVDAGFLAKS